MRVLKLSLLIVFIMMLGFLSVENAQADKEATPDDYAIITADKKFIFVMLIPDEEIMQAWKFLGEEPTFYETRVYDTKISQDQYFSALRETFSLRTKYPCSGLYKNDGSTTPIWTVNWYGSVYLFPDGEYLIRKGPWNRGTISPEGKPIFDGLAVAFYKNGNEVAKYSVDDLVKDTSKIRPSISHFEWAEKEEFDFGTGLLYIETLDHLKYTFDIRKMGRFISGRRSYCKPNYRFSSMESKSETSSPSMESDREIQAPFISVIVLLIVIGCARFVDVVQKYRR